MKLGVFGGTFNPIHLGHLHLARLAAGLFDLEEVHFVVSTSPPHKSQEGLAPLIHRYAMVSLATSDTPAFIPSLIELEPPNSSFSLHTMEKLATRIQAGGMALYFIAGGDSLLEVAGWHKSEELLVSYNFIFVVRPGVAAGDPGLLFPHQLRDRVIDLRGMSSRRLRSRVPTEISGAGSRMFIIDAGAPDISSSQVRRILSAGKTVNHLVPAPVCEYIQKLHLYGDR